MHPIDNLTLADRGLAKMPKHRRPLFVFMLPLATAAANRWPKR
jgi:hypothetical protein